MGVLNASITALVGTLSVFGLCYGMGAIKLEKWPLIGKYKCYATGFGTVALLTLIMAFVG